MSLTFHLIHILYGQRLNQAAASELSRQYGSVVTLFPLVIMALVRNSRTPA
ncbi:MAG: hypothetical protein LBT86_00550 [Deltaproteobacteria bacterium]|nr:hypothetical protein [Deltaproteobacteria bacterium]